MVRTRGLRQNLGKVLGRTLDRQVTGDEEEASHRRRLTTSTQKTGNCSYCRGC